MVKLSELKGHASPVRSFPVADSDLSQGVGVACEEQEEEPVDLAVRKRNRKPAAASDGGEVRTRGRRQKDFDPAAAMEEDEAVEPVENREKSSPATWTQNQQKLLELALQQFPRGTAERWDRIAKVVPGKTKVSCSTCVHVPPERTTHTIDLCRVPCV